MFLESQAVNYDDILNSIYKDLLFEALAALTPLACASDRLIGWRPLLDLSIAVLFIEFLGMSRHCQSIVRVLLVFKKTQPKPIELLSIDYIISGCGRDSQGPACNAHPCLCAVLVLRAALKGVLSPGISFQKHYLALEPVVSEGLSGLSPLESCHNSIHKSS